MPDTTGTNHDDVDVYCAACVHRQRQAADRIEALEAALRTIVELPTDWDLATNALGRAMHTYAREALDA